MRRQKLGYFANDVAGESVLVATSKLHHFVNFYVLLISL